MLAFTLTDGAFPHAGVVLEAQLWRLPQHGPGGALTLRTSVWVQTGTPEGEPAAPRLRGSSTLDTRSSSLALPGACRGYKRPPLLDLLHRAGKLPLLFPSAASDRSARTGLLGPRAVSGLSLGTAKGNMALHPGEPGVMSPRDKPLVLLS